MIDKDLDNKGFDSYRFENNPLEEQFAKEWLKFNKENKIIESVIGYEERDMNLHINRMIQWLGSPVGQDFLRKVMKDE